MKRLFKSFERDSVLLFSGRPFKSFPSADCDKIFFKSHWHEAEEIFKQRRAQKVKNVQTAAGGPGVRWAVVGSLHDSNYSFAFVSLPPLFLPEISSNN